MSSGLGGDAHGTERKYDRSGAGFDGDDHGGYSFSDTAAQGAGHDSDVGVTSGVGTDNTEGDNRYGSSDHHPRDEYDTGTSAFGEEASSYAFYTTLTESASQLTHVQRYQHRLNG